MKFLARLQHIGASEILNIVPKDVYEKVKQKDDHPLFQAYVVGQEGEAHANLVGIGQKVMNWFSSAINKLWKKLQYGTKIFHGHNLDSSHEGRKTIGEVVGKTLKTIKDKTSAIAIAYIYPEYRELPLDIASIEADIMVNPDASVHDVDVGDITGIALGSSMIETPGFAGATLLSQIQAFAKDDGKGDNNNNGGKRMTLKEIKEAITEGRIQVDELFDMAEIGKNKAIQEHFQESGNIKRYERLEKKFTEKETEWGKKEKEFEGKIKEMGVDSAKIKANDLFTKKAKDRKLDDKQIKFITAKKNSFAPEDVEKLDTEVDKFMDDKLDEYKETAKIFGEEESNEDKKGGSEPGDESHEGDASHIPD